MKTVIIGVASSPRMRQNFREEHRGKGTVKVFPKSHEAVAYLRTLRNAEVQVATVRAITNRPEVDGALKKEMRTLEARKVSVSLSLPRTPHLSQAEVQRLHDLRAEGYSITSIAALTHHAWVVVKRVLER